MSANPSTSNTINDATQILHQGGVVAYPTEAVFGLGCDPHNEAAVAQVRGLKGRQNDNGLILIASAWEQVQPLVGELPEGAVDRVHSSWPGFVTWVFPASPVVPAWIAGPGGTVALRVTDHPVARSLCAEFGGPIVSTSANPSSQPPATTTEQVQQYFKDDDLYILAGSVGKHDKPSQIFDAVSGKQLR